MLSRDALAATRYRPMVSLDARDAMQGRMKQMLIGFNAPPGGPVGRITLRRSWLAARRWASTTQVQRPVVIRPRSGRIPYSASGEFPRAPAASGTKQ